MERRLVALLAADVVGYSRLMGEDEVSTLTALKKCEEEVIEPVVESHGGHIVKRMGDGYLIEFTSTIDCIECALEWQRGVENSTYPFEFRLGINLGDVLTESGDIYGDDVNIAARIEELAEPGGISLSGEAYDQVKRKLPYNFTFTGEHRLKNISDPVRIYRLYPDPDDSGRTLATGSRERPSSKVMLPLLILLCVVLSVTGYFYYRGATTQESQPSPTAISGGSDRQYVRGASIAVLPFKNLSNDEEQEYFSDGITNDIITDLSRFHDLLVISSNTVFRYKGATVNAKEVGQELGVQYLLEGTVQKSDDQVRINAQLVESHDGTHIWAERYNQRYADIFELQAEIVKSIVAKLAIKVSQNERDRAIRTPPQDLDAYDYFLRGYAFYSKRIREANNAARDMFSKAISIDPYYADAVVGMGLVEYAKVSYGWTEFPLKSLENALQHAQKAVELDRDNASAHTLLCSIYTFQNKYDLALHEAEQALELNPNNAEVYSQMGWTLLWAGNIDEAITALQMSLRLDNNSIRNAWLHLGMAYYLRKEYNEALQVLGKGVIKRPNFVGYHLALAATYAQLERFKEAESSAADVLRFDPFFEVESFGTAFKNEAHRSALADGLRKAGLK
jgi:adenylate cyclase